MFTYFSVIFEVHYIIFSYNVCPKENMNLLSRLVNGTRLEDIESEKKTKRSGVYFLHPKVI